MTIKGLLAHTAADTKNTGVVGPIFDDLRFEFIPIKISTRYTRHTYSSIPAKNKEYGTWLSDFLSPNLAEKQAHSDPDFRNCTFGQPNNRSTKVLALQKLLEGDYLFFLASLVPYSQSVYRGNRYFLKSYQKGKKNKYIFGFFKVKGVANINIAPYLAGQSEDNRIDIELKSGSITKEIIKTNEHYKSSFPFTLIVGHKDQSCRLEKAVQLTERQGKGSFILNNLGRRIRGRKTDTLMGVRWLNEVAVNQILEEIKRVNT